MAKFKVLKPHCLGGGRDAMAGDVVDLPQETKLDRDRITARVREGWIEPVQPEPKDDQDETKDAGAETDAGQDETDAGQDETPAGADETPEEPAEAGAREERPAAPRARRGGGSKGGK